jgi:hypothetical protein
MIASAGGQLVTSVPSGTTVALTVTGTASGTVTFCEVETQNCAGMVQAANGTAVLNFVPPPGCQTYEAFQVDGGGNFTVTNNVPLTVTITGAGGKRPSATTIVPSGSAGTYTLTGTVVGYANSAGSPPSPTGTVSFLDTTNAGALLGSAALGAGTLGQTFSLCSVLPVDSEPQAIATGDFNGDGKGDLAVANLFGPTVNILLGNGDGTFTQSQDITTPGQFPPSIAVGNFGGGTDLVVSNGLNTTPQVTFYFNAGHGTFTQGPSAAVPGTPAGLAVALDGSYVAVANGSTTGNVSFVSAGGHTVVQSVPVGSNPDLVVAMSFGVVVTQFNSPGTITPIVGAPGSFVAGTPIPVGNSPIGIASGDFKSFGSARDLAVANTDDDTVSILYGNGSGGFTAGPVLPVGQGPFGVTTGDFNGDGKTDIAVANKIDNTVSVLFGNGDGTFQAQQVLAVGNSPANTVAGNFTGHGNVDLAVTNTADNTVSILPSLISRTANATVTNVTISNAGTNLVEASYPGDGNYAASVSAPTSSLAAAGQTATPTFSPAGGTYASTQSVTIADATSGAAIYYTTDGSTPSTSSTKYTVPITVSSSETIRAVALAPGSTLSAINPASYTIESFIATTTTLTSSANPSISGENVTFTATVTPASGNGVPTGTITGIFSGLTVTTLPLINGVATYTTNTIPTGTFALAADYSGDTHYLPGTGMLTQTVNPVGNMPVINWVPSTNISFTGAPLGTGILDATSPTTPGTFSYAATISGGSPVPITAATVLASGSYTLTATFTPTDTVDFVPSTATISLTGVVLHIWVVNSNGSLSLLDDGGNAVNGSPSSGGGIGAAVDSSGNIWSINASGSSLAKFSNTGSVVSSGYTGGGLTSGTALAIDGAGMVWVVNSNNSVSLFSNTGAGMSSSTGFTGGNISAPTGVAIDTSGNVWISNSGNNSVTRIIGAAAPAAPLSTAATQNTLGAKP